MSILVTSLYLGTAFLGAAFALIEMRMLVRFVRNRHEIRGQSTGQLRSAAIPDKDAPTVTIQLPFYNERHTAERLIRACADQDYPIDRFDIQVLDDSTDDTSRIVEPVVEELRERGISIRHIRRDDRVGYKAGALKEGLAVSDAEFVAIFDADFRPPAGFLRSVLLEHAAFEDESVAFAQTRWAWDGPVRGLFARALALMLDRHFWIQKPTRQFLGHVTSFNGSGGIWRRAAIDDGGGWSAETLTEDLDLTYRCAVRGWRGVYLRDVGVPNELPGEMRAFKLQQRRWSRGGAQCLRKLAPTVVGAPRLTDRLEELFLLAGYAIHPILVANLLLWPAAVLMVDRTAFIVMQAFMALPTLVAPASLFQTIRERDGRAGLDSAMELFAGVSLGIGLMVNNTVAQIHGWLGMHGEFARTPKGHSVSDGAEKAQYRSPVHWTLFAEVALVGYCLWGAGLLFVRQEALWSIPLLFWGGCIAWVVALQLGGGRARAAATA